jgi:hypothetical protein
MLCLLIQKSINPFFRKHQHIFERVPPSPGFPSSVRTEDRTLKSRRTIWTDCLLSGWRVEMETLRFRNE